MLILDIWGISFHAVVVFGLGKNLLFKSMLGRCDYVGSSFVGHKYLDFAHPFPLNVDFSERRT